MSSSSTILPISAQSFLNTLGVDTHIPYTDGGYADIAQVIADMKYLGIDQVRDGITNGTDSSGNYNGSAPLSSYLAMAEAGIKFTFIIEPTSTAYIQSQLSLINAVETAVPGSVTAIEGPNEINNQPITFNGISGLPGALAAQQALYAAVKADPVLAGVPVDYFTGYDAGGIAVGPDPTTTPGLANYDTQHPYPNFGQAPEAWVNRTTALPNAANPATTPAVYTETGYNSGQVDLAAQAKYELDLVMDTAQEGIAKTYLYDLMDAYAPGSTQGDDQWGLFDYTTAPKPVATALHNLTALLQDTGATAGTFTPTPLSYSLSGLSSTGNSMMIEKSDGTYRLVIWAEPQIENTANDTESAAPVQNVTVTLPQSFAGIQVFDPLSGTAAIASYAEASTVIVAVSDHPVVIELGKTAPAVVAGPTDTLTLNLSEDAYDGDAQVMVSVDGKWVGNVETVTASKAEGQAQNVTLTGNFSAGAHTVAVTFLNDLYGGSTTTDRNLYVNSITLDGATTVENSPQLSTGTVDYNVTSGTIMTTPPITTPPVTGMDTLVLNLSENSYLGDAQFTVMVDGVQLGTTQTVTALKDSGASQNFTFTGNLGSGPHTVAVDFLNDAWDFTGYGSGHDRNLYVNSITLDGTTTVENSAQNGQGTVNYTIAGGTTTPPPASPTVAITSQVLAHDTGASVSDNITSNGAVTLTGTFTGATGTTVKIMDGTTTLGTAALNGTSWTYATTLAAGSHNLTAVATSPTNVTATSAAEPVIVVETVAPAVAITTPSESLTSPGPAAVALAGTVSGASGTTVKIVDGTTALGAATINGSSWSYNASLAVGSHSLTAVATDLAGNTTTSASDAIAVTAPVVTPPVTGMDTLVLNLSENSYLGDAQFTVMVDGVQLGTTQTVTALKDSGASQNFTFTGNLGSGPHTVAVDFLNDAWDFTGYGSGHDRNLYVNSITLDGTTTVENSAQNGQGTVNYTIAGGTTTPPPASPTVAITSQVLAHDTGASVSDNITSNGAVTLTGTFTGATGTTVKIMDGTTTLGTAALNGTSWTYATTLAAGSHNLTAVATSPTNVTATSAAEPVIVVETVAPAVAITTPSESLTSPGPAAVALAGTVSGASGTTVKIVDGTTALGAATINGSSWSYNASLAVGSHSLTAVATDLAGNTTTSASDAIAVTAPVVTPPVTGMDTLVLNLSENSYLGDAQFTVMVDGVQLGTTQTVTALKDSGASQNFTFTGNLGSGPHTVAVDFLNDAWDFTGYGSGHDRNLYVNSITLDGTTTVENSAQNGQGTVNYTIAGGTTTPPPASPTVAITSQVLAHDTGASVSDNITSNGAVTLTGTFTGATGTTVKIMDGTTTLGTAALNGTSWTYATTLAAGSHNLTAVATSPTNVTATSAAEPVIVVETVAPAVAITTPSESLTSPGPAAVALAGTVSGASGTTVKIVDGTTALGAATINGSSWSYNASLAVGSHSLTAVATDLAGNTTTSASDAIAVTVPVTPTAAQDIVQANVSTGSGVTQEQIDLSSSTPISGTFVPTSATGTIGASPLVLYNWNPSTQLTNFLAAQKSGAGAKIVAIGDSTTRGYGASTLGWSGLSYVSELTQALNTDGVPAQNNNFLAAGISISNGQVEDNRIQLVNGATSPFAIDAGGTVIGTSAAGQGVNFTLNTPGNYNKVTVSYIDIGSGSLALSVDGGPTLATLQLGNTGNTLAQTVAIPAGTHSELSLVATNANPTYIQGASFSNSAGNAIQVYNAGIDGWTAVSADSSYFQGNAISGSTNGFGQTAGVAALSPNLVLIDLGINDINSGTATPAQITASIGQIVASVRSVGSDAIIVIPEPFADSAYASTLPVLRADLQALALANNVPLIDLSATYGNSEAALAAAGLMAADGIHPDATLYADIGSQIAALLANTIAGTTTPPPASPTVAITSQVLAHDTGASVSDNITSNGAVTLTGTFTGATGTTVKIMDGTTTLGTAALNGTSWTYATTLAAGSHNLTAVATSPTNVTATSAAEPVIVVETVAPAVAITTPSESLTSSGPAAVALAGTVSGASGTTVKIVDGTTALGAATINGSSWSYNASLAVGSHSLTAVATDLAGNTTTSASDAIAVTVPVTPVTTNTADNITGNLSNALGIDGIVTYNWNPYTQLKNWIAAESAVAAGVPGAQAKIITLGDSTTAGVGANSAATNYRDIGSYPADLTTDLAKDSGILAQMDNFLGFGTTDSTGTVIQDNRIKLVGNSTVNGGVGVGGGGAVQMSGIGEGFDFTLNSPMAYNSLAISYIDTGSGSVTVTAQGGPNGSYSQTLQVGSTGNIETQTIALPSGTYSGVTVVADSASTMFFEGASFSNTTSPAIQVYNAGIDGAWSSAIDSTTLNGNGDLPGALEIAPSLALINFGINDILNNVYSLSQTISFLTTAITEVRSTNTDPVLIIPQPFGVNPYLASSQMDTLAALRSAIETLAVEQNVPVIDLSQTYGDNNQALDASGLQVAEPHPGPVLYADIASRIASLLTGTTQTFAGTQSYIVSQTQNVTGTSGNDTLLGSSTTNVLIGNGGSDTYVLNAKDQIDTIVNGLSGSMTPSGQLDVLGASHNQLWFQQSGNDLVVETLGSTQEAVIKNWYNGSGGQQLAEIVGNDGMRLDSGLQNLVQAMASFSAANGAFNPQTTTHTTLTDGYFGTVATAATKVWHS